MAASDDTKVQAKRPGPPPRPWVTWLAAGWGWLTDLFGRQPRKDAVKDAAATGMMGELLDRTLDNVDGC